MVTATTSVSRHGGGTYRRPGRSYWRQVCLRCVQEACASLDESERERRHAPQYDHTNAADWRHALERLTAPARVSPDLSSRG